MLSTMGNFLNPANHDIFRCASLQYTGGFISAEAWIPTKIKTPPSEDEGAINSLLNID